MRWLAWPTLLLLAGCGARTLGASPQGEPPGDARDAGAVDTAVPPPPGRDAGPSDAGPFAPAPAEPVVDRFVYTDRLDVVWVVDQSPSMDEESAAVRDHLGRFARAVANGGRDLHLTLLASRDGDNGLCVGPPLGGPDCSGGERLEQVDVPVGSHNALVRVQENIAAIEATLRPEVPRVLVVVSDDESAMPSSWFDRWLRGRDGWDAYGAYAVVGIDRTVCPDVESPGRVYQRLAEMRAGRSVPICDPDWNRLVDELAEHVAARPQRFVLSRIPSGPLRVLAGEPPSELPPDAWRFDDGTRSVVVLQRLASGTPVEVRYLADE